jgi:hypothetical protein
MPVYAHTHKQTHTPIHTQNMYVHTDSTLYIIFSLYTRLSIYHIGYHIAYYIYYHV